ncbi:MAG TPA: C2H2-type zinc finger protein [Actinomycetota bacterium]|jgi:DNA-directed RNA polymerase subunit RPC12/RpoP|nr:C2H2-type zinc finger protein [Actinomycetota bacterium]
MANVCAKCGMEFDTPEQLREHERSEHGAATGGSRKAICPTCGMEFESQEELDAHAKSAHEA